MKLQSPGGRPLEAFATTVPAEYYNPIRLAQLRQGSPIDLLLGGRGLHVHLDREAWVITDRNLGDIPVLAWRGLNAARRDGIHRPVPCEMLYYHTYAAVIVRTVLPDVLLRLSSTKPSAGRLAKILFLAGRI